MAMKLKLKERQVSEGSTDSVLTRKERKRMHLGRSVAAENIQRIRLSWYAPFLEELLQTLNSAKTSEYRVSVLTFRYIMMAKRRLPRRQRIRTITNPHTNSVFVWVENRKK